MHSPLVPRPRHLIALAALGLAACGGGLTPEEQFQADAEEYEALQASFDQKREQVAPYGAHEEAGVGRRIFWIDDHLGPETLRSLDSTTGAVVKYTFSVGSDDFRNYRPSESMIVTADPHASQGLVYSVYAADQPEQLIAEFTAEKPPPGERWHAYCPDGDFVYLVVTGDTYHDFQRVNVKTGTSEHLFDLEETGMEVGEFEDFGVGGNTALMIEGGRLWSVDIAAKKATWLGNETEAYGAQWDAQGVFYLSYDLSRDSPFYYTYATGETRDIKAEIAQSDYTLNESFEHLQAYYEGGSMAGTEVAYRSTYGIFLYDLVKHESRPLLLDARDGSIKYTPPTLLETRQLFTTALLSDGSSLKAYFYKIAY
jgi:hypothetical protein